MEESDPIQRQVTLGHVNGLHLTPIQRLVQRASQFQADVQISFDGKSASAQSAMELMVLGATHGAMLTLEASGPDSDEAILAVSRILEGLET